MQQLIAITSQNRKTVTGHAGRCRKFWLYPVDQGVVGERRLVELALEQTFHGTHGMPPGLEGMTAFISQGMGQGMFTRLQRLGVQPFMTCEADLDAALQAYLRGEASLEAEAEGHHHHDEEDHA
ncbi:MAG: NifB/NifX family molybdenum-iron cluster-binding protein [Pseudomonadota bacterium]